MTEDNEIKKGSYEINRMCEGADIIIEHTFRIENSRQKNRIYADLKLKRIFWIEIFPPKNHIKAVIIAPIITNNIGRSRGIITNFISSLINAPLKLPRDDIQRDIIINNIEEIRRNIIEDLILVK